VSICPPALRIVEVMRGQGYLEPGNCPGAETVPLLKPIVATQGDSVVVTREQITVNDRPLPNSEAQRLMPAYPAGHYHVRAGEVWIVSSYS
ncbi:conjugal transfer protein TraF, partial [Escherichia coli]|nr:conjugal transfer protein TraF [Escherichia coli]